MSTRQAVVEAYEASGGNITQVAKRIGLSRGTVYYHLRKAGVKKGPLSEGRVSVQSPRRFSLPRKGKVRRYILTSAQNNTHVHQAVFENLVMLAEHYRAQLCVGTFTYNQNRYGPLSVKLGKAKDKETRLWYAPEVVQYLRDERVSLAPGLHWCGETNTLPTAVDPLSGFEVYTGRASGVFPHAKVAMRSIPAGTKHEPTKFNYTTGTITQRNYVAKRAGQRAEQNHCYGGLLVEVNSAGEWWARQVVAEESGRIQDLDVVVDDGVVTTNNAVEAVTWGDLHSLLVTKEMLRSMTQLRDRLRPRRQFVHDVLLGAVTNHHESRNPHEKFRRHSLGGGWTSLTEELRQAVSVLSRLSSEGSEIIVVDSNHDRPWIERWMRESDGREDPENAVLWLKLNLAYYQELERSPRGNGFHVLEYAMQDLGLDESVRFLRPDESYVITRGRVECGMHGHLGPNGSRGTPTALSRLGRKANTCHTHSAGIWDGLYVGGLSCGEDMGYNQGPSSWSRSHIVTYPGGKRAILTAWNNKLAADL